MAQVINEMPARDYHKIDACSSSWLKAARKGAVEFYHKRNSETEQTDSMLLGEIAHALVFPSSPRVLQDDYAILPESVGRKSKELQAELDADPRIKVSKKIFDKAQDIANSVLSIKMIRRLKDHMDSMNEVTCLFDLNGVKCKCRWDFINPHVGIILDLKTTRDGVDPMSFSSTVAKYLYDQQAAFYVDAAERAYGKKFTIAFVAVSTTAPHDACLFVPDDQMLSVGRQLYTENIKLYSELISENVTDISQLLSQRQFESISLPAWATDLRRR